MGEIRITRICKSCNTRFTIREKEAEWLLLRGLKLFTHCKECRIKRRQERENMK